MKHLLVAAFASIGIGLSAFAPSVEATFLDNGGFESGDLSGWTLVTTSNGTLGDPPLPRVAAFDVNGDGASSQSFQLSVGYVVPPCSVPGTQCPLPVEGGGIAQSVSLAQGPYWVSADVAVGNTPLFGGSNLDGGTFSLLLDGSVRASISIGEILADSIERRRLQFGVFLDAGVHDLQLLVTRNFAQADSLVQYVDNIALQQIPEPGALGLAALGCGSLLVFLRRLRASAA